MGIDLGTTNSLVALVRSGSAEVLLDEDGRAMLPSVVHYGKDGSRLVGALASHLAVSDPLNTLSSAKRLLGRGMADIHSLGARLPYDFGHDDGGMPKFRTCQGAVSPIQVSAEILRSLSERAEKALGVMLDGAVITVPAYFDDAQRQATKDAATLAGIKVLRLLNEPTAAAIAYGLDRADEGIIAVYDLGGGTFDISVLKLTKGVFQVLATGGDSALGGDDFDRAIADWIGEQMGLDLVIDPAQQRQLLVSARAAKESLTTSESTLINVEDWQGQLTREQLALLIEPMIEQTLRACKRALRDARVDIQSVNDIVLVGGSTRTPLVNTRVSEFFGRAARVDLDPDSVVAFGAALQAEVLIGNQSGKERLLLDVIPLSLGIETMGGLIEKIIHRNTTIPVSKAQEFTTFKNGQTVMAIHVLQGERELAGDCRSLARFELRDIPPMVAGGAKIRVTYQVDADGLLSVSAREVVSKVESRIEVKPSYGLGENEISQMLKDSFSHARDDMAARALREQQVEADRLAEDLSAALDHDQHLLELSEAQCLRMAVAELVELRGHCSDHNTLAQQVKALSKASEGFAAKRMDSNIKSALAGHTLDEIDQD